MDQTNVYTDAVARIVADLDAARRSGQPVSEHQIIETGLQRFAGSIPAAAGASAQLMRWQVVSSLLAVKGASGVNDIHDLLRTAKRVMDFVESGNAGPMAVS